MTPLVGRAGADSIPQETAAPAEPEGRTEERMVLLYRVSTIVTGHTRGFCVVKNISVGGAMIRTILHLEIGEPITLTFASGVNIEGRIQWCQGEHAGIQFTTPIELSSVLGRFEGAGQSEPVRRMPRMAISAPATLTAQGRTMQATTCDISTGGVRLLCPNSPMVGAANIQIAGLTSRSGRILWVQRDQVGCIFDHPIGIEDLTRWADALPQ